MPLPAPARCRRLAGKPQRPRDALERARQRDVLHQLERREASRALERIAPDENRLIAGGDPGRARAQVHEKRNYGKQTVLAFDTHIEPPPGPAARRETLKDARWGVIRQARVGVKENQDFAAPERRSRVHLARAAARGRDDAVGGAAREVRSLVARTAVDDDDFMAAFAQRRERRQRLRDDLGFVQHRDDDGNPRYFHFSRASRRETSPPT